MKTMELTEREAALIEEMRQKDEEDKEYRKTTLEILRTAYEYENWLQRNGSLSSYSTFCDEFGYGADSRIYGLVEQVRTTAIARGQNQKQNHGCMLSND